MSELEDLKKSDKEIGQIYPVVKDQHGNIIDGFHRKEANPEWKEINVNVKDALHALRIRVHLNAVRRDVDYDEKHRWVMETRKLLNPADPMQPSQEDVAKALGMSREWVKKYEPLVRRTDVSPFEEKPGETFNFECLCGRKYYVDWRSQVVESVEE